MPKLFDAHLNLLQRSMDFRVKRNSMLASNVANLETPGFKAKDLVFENALGEAMKAHIPGPLNVTNARHMDGRPGLTLNQVKSQVIESEAPEGSLDGNSVDLEKEMAKLGENQLTYQALTQMTGYKFAKLKTVLREGN